MRNILRATVALLPMTGLLMASTAFAASTSSAAAAPGPANAVDAAAPAEPAGGAVPAATTAGESPTPPAASGTTTPGSQGPTAPVSASPSGPAGSLSLSTQEPVPERTEDAPATLFGAKGHKFGGFGGIGVLYTRFAGEDKPQLCAEGGFILDHALTIGAGVCGIADQMNAERYGRAPHYANDRMSFGYGGAIVRYHFFSRNMFNFAVGALIGGGGLSIGTWDGSGDDWSGDYTHKRTDEVFVLEPHIGGYANLTRWLRLGVTVGYRIVSGVDTQGLAASDLSAPTFGGAVLGGWF